MLKLLNKASVSTALAAAIALGSCQAFATLTFNLVQTGSGNTSVSASPGDTISLSLFYTITNPTGAGVYTVGGSFTSTGAGGAGAGYVSAPTIAPAMLEVGSQVGSVGNANGTLWGSTDPFASAAFVYFRADPSNAAGGTGTPTFIPGSGNVLLGTMQYVVSATDPSSFVLNFAPRDRPAAVDQLWQENGATQSDLTMALGASTGVTVTIGAGPTVSTWIASASGSNTDTAGNWSPTGTPNSATAAVVFGQNGSTGTITNSVAHTYNSMTFQANNSYNISGAGTITLAGANAIISTAGGTHSISAPLAAAPGTTVHFNGTGTIIIGAATGGKINFASATGVVIGTGSDTPTVQLAQLSGGITGRRGLDPGGDGTRNAASTVVEMNGLTINSGAVFDITNHDLVIHNGNYAQIEQYLANACDAGGWDLAGSTSLPLLTSSAAENNGFTTIGVMTGLEYGNDNEDGTTFDGITVVPTDVLVKYTYIGDITLDGLVGPDDIGAYLSDKSLHLSGLDYGNGDLLYLGGLGPDATGAEITAFNNFKPYNGSGIGLNGLEVQLPEPGSLSLLGLGVLGLLARRRK